MRDLAAVREARMRNLQNPTNPPPNTAHQTEPAAPAPTSAAAVDLRELARQRAQRDANLSRLLQPTSPTHGTTPSEPALSPTAKSQFDEEQRRLREQREANLQRLLANTSSSSTQTDAMDVDTAPTNPPPTSAAARCVINLRMHDGRALTGEFDANEKFKTVHEYASTLR